MRILSLGAGVQSTTLLLMSCRGDLPKLDAAIFADTQWESVRVYEHLAWLEGIAADAGIAVHRVTAGNLRADYLAGAVGGGRSGGADRRFASMPVFTKDPDAAPDDEGGFVPRQCTREYKLDPIRQKVRELCAVGPGQRVPATVHVEQWIGISTDELRRLRISADRWITHRYPLVFDCNPPMSRSRCIAWLREHYPDRTVPRSACIGCPFHSNAEWRAIRTNAEEWADAISFDAAIRHQNGLRSEAYLHRSCTPLAEADLKEPDPAQGSLWSNECLGMCGV